MLHQHKIVAPVVIVIIFSVTFYSFIADICFKFTTIVGQQILFIGIESVLFLMFFLTIFNTYCTTLPRIPDEFKLSFIEFDEYLQITEAERKKIYMERILEQRNLPVYMRNKDGTVRVCLFCRQIKPDRTHHCSVCGVCRLQMDHHCYLVSNCIGFLNYKLFILLLIYTLFYCGLYIYTALKYVSTDLNVIRKYPSIDFGIIFCGATFSFTGILLVWHIYLIIRNKTFIEMYQNTYFIDDNLTFNLGAWNNFKQVFGSNLLLWLWPSKTCLGNGYDYFV